MTEEEFVEAERHFEVKHDFLSGVPHAIAGASTRHNVIATNLVGILHAKLRGKPCQAFGSDMKVKIQVSASTYFYYPDAMIVCDQAGLGASWSERPTVLFEILSESTRSIDEREKRITYQCIPGLAAYVLIEQDAQRVIVEHRVPTGWQRETIDGVEGIVRLSAVDAEIPLSELYERA